jgi:hypothetical protein
MQGCPQCGKLLDPVPTTGAFCSDCAAAIRDEGGLPAMLQRLSHNDDAEQRPAVPSSPRQ